MKTFNRSTLASLSVAAFSAIGLQAANGQPDDPQYTTTSKRSKTDRAKYTQVTGSLIPQRVKVKAVGTATQSNLRVIDRHEIDQSGRHDTAGAVAQDPSIRVFGH